MMHITNKELFFKYMGLPSLRPIGLEIVDAEGIFLYSADGKRYYDLVSGVTVSNLGHKNPAIIKAIKDQADKYLHLMVYGEYIEAPQVLLAKKLADSLPDGLDCTYFVNSGSEAIEGAMKLAKRYTGRTGIISFRDAYHGGTHGALSVTGNERMKNAFRPLLPDVTQIEFNNFEELHYITGRTVCVIAETIQAEAGIILPQEGYLQALRKRCTEVGALLVIDDVQMGFGRTGRLFSYEHYGIVPDILVLAKALGGGMPLGAFISSQEIMRSLTTEPELGHITTFGGHPVSCAAALAHLEELTKGNLIPEAETKGKLFYDLMHKHAAIKEIRRAGLMLAIEIGDEEKMQKLYPVLLEHGIVTDLFLFKPSAFRISPPLIITEEQIKEVCNIIIDCLDVI